MKKLNLLFVFAAIFIASNLNAQAWEKSSKVLSLGMGGSSFFYIDGNDNYWSGLYTPVTGQLNFQGEFGIHDYVGLGFTTGFGGGAGNRLRGWYGYYGYNGNINVPVGMIANFHFYQLIADKTGENIHSDKLDVYAGVNVGGGIGVLLYDNADNYIVPIAFGGFQAGARYYFTPKFGVNAEVGYGKSFINGGICFKL